MSVKKRKTVVASDDMRTMDVARALRVKYARARDMMLEGRFGETVDHPFRVSRTAVEAFIAARETPA